MNPRLLRMLCCPLCKGEGELELELRIYQQEPIPRESGAELDDDEATFRVREGLLLCATCRVWYPVLQYVPVMLPGHTSIHESFARRHAEELTSIPDFGPPAGEMQVDETSVQDTFSDQWLLVNKEALSFTYTTDDLIALNRRVWLKWLRSATGPVSSVLNVGCGLGREAVALHAAVEGAEVYAIDLNLGLLQSLEVQRPGGQIHFVLASLFSLPFRLASFDLVYSQGVIHHTHSTRDAFRTIAPYAKPGGYMFIWLYGLVDRLTHSGATFFLANAMHFSGVWLRPVLSRTPKPLRDAFFGAFALLCHPLLKRRAPHPDKWGLRNTNHSLRDFFSTRYRHLHSYNEVIEWFEELDFQVIDTQSARAYRELFGKQIFGVGLTGQRGNGA